MMNMNKDMLFLDFEASGLSTESWPIEIGISWITDDRVSTWSSLIAPRQTWAWSEWSEVSAGVHRIHQAEVVRGPAADDVAREVLDLVSGKILVCDAPDYDGRWMTRLLEGHPNQDIALGNFDQIAAEQFVGHKLDVVYEGLARRRAPHRAGPDSARLAGAFLDGYRADKAER